MDEFQRHYTELVGQPEKNTRYSTFLLGDIQDLENKPVKVSEQELIKGTTWDYWEGRESHKSTCLLNSFTRK